MKLSCIVTVYNIQGYIRKCLDSIISQINSECELVVIDDGSSDGSEKICDSYAEKYSYVKVHHITNGGVANARNYGINVSQGDYFTFVDGDDYVSNSMISDMLEVIGNNPDVILSSEIYKDDESGRIKGQYRFDEKAFCGISGEDAIMITASKRADWSPCGKVFNKSFWLREGFAFKRGTNWEDFQMVDKVVLAAQNVYMVPGFYYYRMRNSSITHNVKEADLIAICEALDDWNIYLKNNDINLKVVSMIRKQHALLFCKTVMGYVCIVGTENREGLVNMASKYKNILDYNDNFFVRMIRTMVNILGFNNTCIMLGTIKKIRYSHIR